MTACAAARALRLQIVKAQDGCDKSLARRRLFKHMVFCQECVPMTEIQTEWGRATVIGKSPDGSEWLVSIGKNGHTDAEWAKLSPRDMPFIFRWIAAEQPQEAEA